MWSAKTEFLRKFVCTWQGFRIAAASIKVTPGHGRAG